MKDVYADYVGSPSKIFPVLNDSLVGFIVLGTVCFLEDILAIGLLTLLSVECCCGVICNQPKIFFFYMRLIILLILKMELIQMKESNVLCMLIIFTELV